MKLVIVVALALVAVTAAAPVDEPPKILSSDLQQQPDGSYTSSFETENGIKQSETGELKQVPDEENKPTYVVVVRGGYSYPGEDGNPISITYYADETGFHAEGKSIPTAA